MTSRTHAYQNQGWRLQGFAEATLASQDGQIRRLSPAGYELTHADLGRLPASKPPGGSC